MAFTIEVFYCYARKDQLLLDELKMHLIPLKREGLISLWNDTDISPGTEWEQEINKHLNTARIILLLVSPSFMASEYCYSKEMKRAIERHELGEARVIPVILRPVDWKGAPFGKLQALPKNAKPVISWRKRDEAFLDIAIGIRKAAEQLTMRLPETAETIMMKLSKTPEVPLIETTDVVPTTTQPQLSVISKSTPSSPPVSEDKEVFLALEKGEQALRYDFDWDDLSPPNENYKDDSPAATTGGADQPSLTVKRVKRVWDRVMKRVKQRSSTTAAMLKYYDVVGVEGTTELTVIVIQAQKQGHYNYVNEQDRSKDVEWALTTEFGQKCRVRLLPPGSPLEPQISLQLVQEAWDKVMKRVKQRSSTTAAMLRYFNIVGVEGMSEQAVIVIQAQKQGHYNFVNDDDRLEYIEWALTTEFSQKCGVRLLPPGSPLDHSV